MIKIVGLAEAISKIGQFRFDEFRIVREFRFFESRVNEGNLQISQDLELTVESEGRTPNYQIRFLFQGVSGLSLRDFGGGETRIVGLDILDISERQWQSIAWEVIDFENDVIKLYSKTVAITRIVEKG